MVDSLNLSPGALKEKVVYAAADSLVFDVDAKKVYLYNQGSVTYGEILLTAGIICMDFGKNTVTAEPCNDSSGNKVQYPHFKEDKEFDAVKLSYNFKSKRGSLEGIITKEGEGFILGQRVRKEPDNTLYIRNADYTTCDTSSSHEPHPHFYIHASKLKVIPGKQIITARAGLYVADVPTPLILPFGFFPVQKGQKSGFLLPQQGFGEQPGRGFFLKGIGYYFALGSHHDLALTTDLYTLGSRGVNLASNYNYRYKFNGRFVLNLFRNKNGEDDAGTKEFSLSWNHTMDPKFRPNTTFNINIKAASSRYNRLNTYNLNDITNNQFNSSISFAKSFGKNNRFNLNISATHSQNTQTRLVSMSLPSVSFSVATFYPFRRAEQVGKLKWFENIGVLYNLSARNQIDTYDTLLFKRTTLQNLKYGITHPLSIQLPTIRLFKYFTLAPSVNYQEYWYLQTLQRTFNPVLGKTTDTLLNGFERAYQYSFRASLNTYVYGTVNKAVGRFRGIRHVIQPRLDASYAPDFSGAYFGFMRSYRDTANNLVYYSKFEKGIMGGPSTGATGQLGFSLNNQLDMKWLTGRDTTQKVQKFRLIDALSLTTSYNFLNKTNPLSPLVTAFRTTLFKKITINAGANFDAYALDAAGKRTSELLYRQVGKWARFTGGGVSLSTNFSSDELAKLMASPKATDEEKKMLKEHAQDLVSFAIPWTLNLSYTYQVSQQGLAVNRSVTHSLNISGNVNVTSKWKVGFNSFLDLKNQRVVSTSFDFYRDLHCWDMKFSWIPFGNNKFYLFTLNPKSSILQDLKLSKRRDWNDR